MKNRPGRPKSRATKEDFTRKKILAAVGFMTEFWFGSLVDHGLLSRERGVVKVTAMKNLEAKYYQYDGSPTLRTHRLWNELINRLANSALSDRFSEIYFPSEMSRVAFSDGVRFALEELEDLILPTVINDLIEDDGLSLNISTAVRRDVTKEERFQKSLEGLPKDVIEKKMKIHNEMKKEISKLFPMPNDIRRQIQRPSIRRSDCLKLLKIVRDFIGLAYEDEVSRKMHLSMTGLEELANEAIRQKLPLDRGFDQRTKKTFLMAR